MRGKRWFSDDRAEGAVMEPNLSEWLINFSFPARTAGTGTLRLGLFAIGIRQLKEHTQNGTDHERSYDQER